MKMAFTFDDLPLWPMSYPPAGYTVAGMVDAIIMALDRHKIRGVYAFANSRPLLEHPEFKALTHAAIIAGEPQVLPSLGTNIRSIAASVGIPKETARRKLTDLVEAGWLVRQGWDFRMTTKCYAGLEPVRLRLQSLALSYHDLLGDLLGR